MTKTIIILVLLYAGTLPHAQAQDKTECDLLTGQIERINTQKELSKLLNKINSTDLPCQFSFWKKKADALEKLFLLDSACTAYDQASKIAETLEDDERYLDVALTKAYLYIRLNKKTQASQTLSQCRKKLDRHPQSKHWISYYNYQAYYQDGERNYQDALQYVDSGIVIGEKFNLSLLHRGYLEKTSYHIRLSQFQEAISSVQRGISLIEKLEDSEWLAYAYFLKGVCYERIREFKNAAQALETSIQTALEHQDLQRAARSYSRLSISLVKLKDEKRALEALDSTIAISKRIKDYSTLALGYSDKALALLHLSNDYEAAEAAFIESNRLFATKEVSQRTKDITSVSNFAGLVMTSEKRKDYKKMLIYLKQFEQEANKLDLLIHKKDIALFYMEYYEGIGDFKKALKFNKQATIIADSVTNKEVRLSIADLEKKYETQKKENEILILNKEKQEQELKAQQAQTRQFIAVSTAILCLALLIVGLWAFVKIKKQQQVLHRAHGKLKESHEQVMSLSKIKDHLFSIIAHDLRGMVLPFQRVGKTIKYHIDRKNYDTAVQLSQELEKNSQSLSNMLDNLLKWSLDQMNGYNYQSTDIYPKEELKEIIKGFEQHSVYKETKVELTCEEDLQVKFDKGAFHVVFRNLISNALKYTEKGKVEIEFKKSDSQWVCSVVDTGIGMSEEQLKKIFNMETHMNSVGTHGEKGTGLGLNLVQRFVQKHQGVITVNSQKNVGSSFNLSFPAVT